MIRGKARLGAAGTVGLAALLLAFTLAAPAQAQDDPGPPSGDGIEPVFVDGNPTCSVLDPGTFELRVDPVVEGTFTDGFLTVTITDIRDTVDGPVFDWTSNIGVDSVFVKGGSGGNFYLYDPPAENTGDTNLHSPINPQNDKFAGLSHISFCYDIQPSIKVEKSGDELSKVGDKVKYDFEITNDGDIPLDLDSVTDTLLGDLAADAITAGCDSLDVGESCSFSVERTVQAGDPDPLPNTVTVQYSGELPSGDSTTVTDSDDHSVNLFQPSLTIDKTGDTLSKVGDTVNYTITVANTSSADSPDLICDVTDPLIGTLADDITLEPGDSQMFTPSRVVQAGDPDPLVNTGTANCTVDGFPNTLSKSDDHSVNLFQPSVAIKKEGTELSKIGDPVDYAITVTNTSSADSPNLTCDITDPTVGVDKQDVNLAPGGEDVTAVDDFVIPADADDPFVNTASVDCTVDGFPNKLDTQTASHEVNLFQPSVLVEKTGPAEAFEGDTITYDYTITNTSSADSPDLILETVIDDVVGDLTAVATANGCATLAPVAPGSSCSFSATYTIPAGTPSPLVNTVVVDYHPDKFENEIKDDDDHSVIIKPPEKFEGCTPGFWKNHLQAWVGFSPNQTLESVFDVPNAFGLDNSTLLQALSFNGGSGAVGAARILLRAGVAALLNAADPDVDYPRTVAEVIADVNAALASGSRATMLGLATELDTDNNLGCPI